jgi:hypothetical protein
MSSNRRVRLCFDRNQDRTTRSYRIYRSTSSGVSNRSPLIMRVAHPRKVNYIDYNDLTIMRTTSTVYKLSHSHINPIGIQVRVNNTIVSEVSIDYLNGILKFDNPLFDTDVVTSTYEFDGVEIIDDSAEQEAMLQYLGVPAVDNSLPHAPVNLTMVVTSDYTNAHITFTASGLSGVQFYYCIEAINDKGYTSKTSREMSIYLQEGVDYYRIESRMNPADEWTLEKTTVTTAVDIFGMDREPPESLQDLTHTITPIQNSGLATIDFTWTTPLLNAKVRVTPMFQIKSVSREGIISEPSITLGPIMGKSPLSKLVIRRKVYDGTYPSFSGLDATDVVTITDLNISQYTDTLQSAINWAYSFFIMDLSENLSPVVTLQLNVPDTIPPEPARSVQVSIHNRIL